MYSRIWVVAPVHQTEVMLHKLNMQWQGGENMEQKKRRILLVIGLCIVLTVAFLAILQTKSSKQQYPSDLVPIRGGDWTSVTSFEGKVGETLLINGGELDQSGALKASRITELFHIWSDFYPVNLDDITELGPPRYQIYLNFFSEDLISCTISVYSETVIINGNAYGGVDEAFLNLLDQRIENLRIENST